MEENNLIQNVLDAIDNRITESITPRELARDFGYSTFHFSRLFSRVAKIPPMAYITRRKLQYALFDISCGEKIIDVALKYGFETHAGFTRAFKKCFGYPPSLYRIHAICRRPARMELDELKSIVSGGRLMNTEIVELKPFNVVGFTSRHKMPDVRFTHDVPLYWETSNMDTAAPLTRLHDVFSQSKHTEYCVCFDIDQATGEFTYLLGVGVDNPEELSRLEPDMYKMKMPGGLYARFTTPLVEDSKLHQTVSDLWKNVLDHWLPASVYKFDEKRYDFEYYDERDHPWETNGMVQMDIYLPLQKRRA
jgi:AraC family transcriptional regulator